MTWKDVGRMAAKTAPILAGALGGPAGAIASAAGSLLASFLGQEPEPEAVAEALRDPATMLRLRELEAQERARLLEWQAKQVETDLANVRDARRREVALAKAGHGAAWATTAVALIVTAGFFAMLRVVLGQPEVSEAALLLLGSLGTAFGAVVNYYLGSSLGSSQKNRMLSEKAR